LRRIKVLFVCIGNACRSQMAEAFANKYGSDVLEAESAGVAPASMIPEVTHKVMAEKGIKLGEQFPKGLSEIPFHEIELVVNMSGVPMRVIPGARTRDWRVKDPMGEKESVHAQVRDEIERYVMTLVLELRQQKAASAPGSAPGSPRI